MSIGNIYTDTRLPVHSVIVIT